jgi:hypothetical protein
MDNELLFIHGASMSYLSATVRLVLVQEVLCSGVVAAMVGLVLV